MIEIGKSMIREIDIDDARSISFMGPELRVYSTPAVLADIEMACRDLLLSMLDDGQDSVGHQVSMEHLDAVPLGGHAQITAKITAIDRRRITFEASATSGARMIARATHVRVIVAVADLKARIASLS